jgi:hypothetical protein
MTEIIVIRVTQPAMLPRHAMLRLLEALDDTRVVTVEGPRGGSIATPTAVRQCFFFLGFLTTRCTTLDGHFETGGSCHALVVPSS